MKNEEFGCAMQACRKVILHSSFLVLHFAKLSFISISIPLRNMNQDQSYNKRISTNLSTLDTIPDYPLTYRCLHECWKSVCKCR